MRWGILVLLCYGAMLVQLSFLRHDDTAHHEESSRLLLSPPAAFLVNNKKKKMMMIRRHSMRRHNERRKQNGPPRQEIPEAQEAPVIEADVVLKNRTLSHLYLCVRSNGRRITLPRVPNFIIGGKFVRKEQEGQTLSCHSSFLFSLFFADILFLSSRHTKGWNHGAHETHQNASLDCRYNIV